MFRSRAHASIRTLDRQLVGCKVCQLVNEANEGSISLTIDSSQSPIGRNVIYQHLVFNGLMSFSPELMSSRPEWGGGP